MPTTPAPNWQVIQLPEHRPTITEDDARAMGYLDLDEAHHDAETNGWADTVRWPA